jgi:tartrate dehydrogenase/decarboxylase/D-malate dehydrogenase
VPSKNYRIALIPGDGIGKEVIPAAVKVLNAAARASEERLSLSFREFDWGCEHYLSTRQMMPEDGLEQLRAFDAILLGAIGLRSVPDHVSLR